MSPEGQLVLQHGNKSVVCSRVYRSGLHRHLLQQRNVEKTRLMENQKIVDKPVRKNIGTVCKMYMETDCDDSREI